MLAVRVLWVKNSLASGSLARDIHTQSEVIQARVTDRNDRGKE